MRRKLITPSERQTRRSTSHGVTMIAWGIVVLLFGEKQFETSTYTYFILDYWVFGLAGVGLGLLVLKLARNFRAAERAIPGRIIATFWTLISVYLLLGNFRVIHIPLYIMLAYNSFTFLVKE